MSDNQDRLIQRVWGTRPNPLPLDAPVDLSAVPVFEEDWVLGQDNLRRENIARIRSHAAKEGGETKE